MAIRLNNFIELDPNKRGSLLYIRRLDALSSAFVGTTKTTIRFVLTFPRAQAGGTLLSALILVPAEDRDSTNELASKAIGVSVEAT